jgi:hypothetical protein
MQAYYFIFFFELLYFYKKGFEWLRKLQEFTVKKNTEEQNRISSYSSQRTLSLFYLTLWIIYSDDVKIL